MSLDDPLQESVTDPAFLLSRVGTAVQGGFKELLAGWKLRPLELVVLRLLDTAGDGASQQQLCEASGIDSGNMVEFIDVLEALQYAKRTRDPSDRRRYIVTITPAGRSAITKITRAVNGYSDTMLGPLSQAERQELVRMLAKLYAGTPEGRWQKRS